MANPLVTGYVREYLQKIWPYMVQYLHFRILDFPLNMANPLGMLANHYHIKQHIKREKSVPSQQNTFLFPLGFSFLYPAVNIL